MFLAWKKVATFFVLSLVVVTDVVQAQDSQIEYLEEGAIAVAWTYNTASSVNAGNGAFLSPDGTMLVVVGSDGKVTALNAATGAEMWTYQPMEASTSTSGAFFNTEAVTPYIAYSVASGGSSKVITLDFAGTFLFETGSMEGEAKGTPVTTKDGKYILSTHNTGGDTGHFSMFDIEAPQTTAYKYTNPIGGPFGSIGYYHNPELGYFPGGEGNTNDLFIWGIGVAENQSPGNLTGQIFGFQLPALNVTLIGPERNFLADTPPVIADRGYKMYWSVSRSEAWAWVGSGLARDGFDLRPNTIKFDLKGNPRYIDASAPPTLSSDPTQPIVYGPTAANQIFRTNFDFSEGPLVVNTTTKLTNRVLVSKDDQYIYYATPDGVLYQLDGVDLDQRWMVTVGNGVAGEIAQSNDGTYIYVADTTGVVNAYMVTTGALIATPPPTTGGNETVPPNTGNVTAPPATTTVPGSAPPSPAGTLTPSAAGSGTPPPTSISIATIPPTAVGPPPTTEITNTTEEPSVESTTIAPSTEAPVEAPVNPPTPPTVTPSVSDSDNNNAQQTSSTSFIVVSMTGLSAIVLGLVLI